MYLELHDIVFFSAVCNDKYNINLLNYKPKIKIPDTRQSEKYEITKKCLKKTDEDFCTPSKRLISVKRKHIIETEVTKNELTKLYKDYFKTKIYGS